MKLLQTSFIFIATLLLIACGNVSKVSQEGTTDEPIWPKLDSSTFNSSGTQIGSWPNWENVNMIEPGMNKDQLYYLIGRPHFAEGFFGVREWDYVFNFRENGVHKVCQYKILFDKDMNAQSFFWYPDACNHKYQLSGDFLFDFNSAELSAKGKEVISDIVAKLKDGKVTKVNILGYTDRLGSEDYNLKLSQRRADAVRQYMAKIGFPLSDMQAIGLGKADQIKACDDVPSSALKECLRPNRRVIISAL